MKTEKDNPPVVVKGLHKSFGEQTVLSGIDLTVGRGETVAVLGRSGTGKSVLLKLIVGLDQPDSGSISIQGQEIEDLDECLTRCPYRLRPRALRCSQDAPCRSQTLR